MMPNLHQLPLRSLRQSQGVVLLIAMIALVALTLAGVAIVRQVDTATQIAGNLTFRQSSVNTADMAIELIADSGFAELKQVSSRYQNSYSTWYRATMFTDDNPESPCAASDANCIRQSGIPNVLQNVAACRSSVDAAASTLRAVWDASTGNCATMVVERLCRNTGAATGNHCILYNEAFVRGQWTEGQKGYGLNTGDITPPQNGVGMRLSVRVDGPRGTTSYLQAVLVYPLPE